MIKNIFFDLDGTMLNQYGIVTGGSQVIGYYATTDTIGNELATGGFAFVEV